MASQRSGVKQPPELRLVVALTYVSGILEIVVGVLVILLRYADGVQDIGGRPVVTILGSFTILFGLFTVALASGIARARRSARTLLTVIFGASIAIAVAVTAVDPTDLWFRGVDIAVTAGLIVVMWTGRTGRYFGDRAAAASSLEDAAVPPCRRT